MIRPIRRVASTFVASTFVARTLPMKVLGYRADLQSVAYMLLATLLLAVQWQAPQLNIGMYLLTLALAFATSIMNHNHRHLPMWRSRWLNRLTDCWFTLFLGHPGFVFEVCHERNHHRYRNGEQDWTRTCVYAMTTASLVLFATRWIARSPCGRT